MPTRTVKAAPKKSSAQARVADAIRSAILSGELQPGDAITELHLAETCHVSQTTVREALVRLEQAGYVRRVANRGTFVTSLSASEFHEHVRLRLLLEGLAASEAAKHSNARAIEVLGKALQKLSDAVMHNDYLGLAESDLEFHRHIWAMSGDRTLARILEQISAPMFVFASLRRRSKHEDLAGVVLAHEPIVEALKDGSSERAAEAMRRHIGDSYRWSFVDSEASFHHVIPEPVD